MTDRETAQLGPSSDGSVMIDIGGDRGALVIMTSVDLLGAEIEIDPVDPDAAPGWSHEQHEPHAHGDGHAHDEGGTHQHGDGHPHAHGRRVHVAVRERRGPGGVRHAAIFPSLREGDYTLYDPAGGPSHDVTIVGGQVAELDWNRES